MRKKNIVRRGFKPGSLWWLAMTMTIRLTGICETYKNNNHNTYTAAEISESLLYKIHRGKKIIKGISIQTMSGSERKATRNHWISIHFHLVELLEGV